METNSTVIDFRIELYSVVLSTTLLFVAVLFGSGSNITLLLSMYSSNILKKYTPTVLLLVASLVLDLVWCPMEIYRLIHYYHHWQDMDINLLLASPSFYILVVTVIICILLCICVCRLCKRSYRAFSLYIVLCLCVILILGLTIGYGVLAAQQEAPPFSYQLISRDSYIYRIVIYSLWVLSAIFMLIVVMTFKRDISNDVASNYSEAPTPERLNIPTLLIKGTEDDDNDDENISEEKALASSTTYLQETGGTKEDNTSTVGDLPTKSKGNQLGVNMAAILGRRRHTIGQIGPTGLEVAKKATNYNYVRKFSVDIQALQAQLQNPKVNSGTLPFRSDTELQMSSSNKATDLPKKPLTPLLGSRHPENIFQDTGQPENIQQANDIILDEYNVTQYDVHATEENSSYESPPMITLSESTGDELNQGRRPEKDPLRLKENALLLLTFIMCLLPMFITETFRRVLSVTAYINILTCTLSLSVLQTIIFPHVLFCMDNVIHVAVYNFFSNLQQRTMNLCYRRQAVPTSDHHP